MEDNAIYYGNPWLDDDRSLGSLKNTLLLAERTGHIKQGSQTFHSLPEEETKNVASLQMIEILKDIQEKRSQIHETCLSIQHHQQEHDTKDLTQTAILEKRIASASDLNNHLQKLVGHKDQLISRLQQPFVGDFIKLEFSHHKYAAEVVPQMVPILADLTKQLNDVEWMSKVDWNDGTLEGLLGDISGTLAALQSNFQSMHQLRSSMQQVHSQRSGWDT